MKRRQAARIRGSFKGTNACQKQERGQENGMEAISTSVNGNMHNEKKKISQPYLPTQLDHFRRRNR